MALWKLLYAALQLAAIIIPALQKGRGVDMRPIGEVATDHLWTKERKRLRKEAGQ